MKIRERLLIKETFDKEWKIIEYESIMLQLPFSKVAKEFVQSYA